MMKMTMTMAMMLMIVRFNLFKIVYFKGKLIFDRLQFCSPFVPEGCPQNGEVMHRI